MLNLVAVEEKSDQEVAEGMVLEKQVTGNSET